MTMPLVVRIPGSSLTRISQAPGSAASPASVWKLSSVVGRRTVLPSFPMMFRIRSCGNSVFSAATAS